MSHTVVLQAVLVAIALIEGVRGGLYQVFFPRRSSEWSGRTWDPAYHELAQDFGFYNFALAGLLFVAALDPARYAPLLWVVVALYLVHGATHLLRHFGIYYGGGARVPTRPPRLDLKQGANLLFAAALVGLLLVWSAR